MNKIVKRFYPVERLPADLQPGLPRHGRVHIELQPALDESEPRSIAGLVGTGRNIHGTVEAVLNQVRSLREDR